MYRVVIERQSREGTRRRKGAPCSLHAQIIKTHRGMSTASLRFRRTAEGRDGSPKGPLMGGCASFVRCLASLRLLAQFDGRELFCFP